MPSKQPEYSKDENYRFKLKGKIVPPVLWVTVKDGKLAYIFLHNAENLAHVNLPELAEKLLEVDEFLKKKGLK